MGCLRLRLDVAAGRRWRDAVLVLCEQSAIYTMTAVCLCIEAGGRNAGSRDARKIKAAPCGLPHMPALGIAACAEAGRTAANRPACNYTSRCLRFSIPQLSPFPRVLHRDRLDRGNQRSSKRDPRATRANPTRCGNKIRRHKLNIAFNKVKDKTKHIPPQRIN
jgi:hypothetical protein